MPRRKNAGLKLLQGTARPGRQRRPPRPDPVFPAHPPRGMIAAEAKAARWFWKNHAPKLEELGLAKEIDIPAFYVMAMTYETIVSCEDAIREHGVLVAGARGEALVKNPAFGILNAARQQFRLQCQQFGLDPNSREKMDAPAQAEDPEDAMEKLLSK